MFLRGINLFIQFIKSPCYKIRFTTPMCFMFFLFSAENGLAKCFVCFCVFLARSSDQVTPPTCLMCFCVFSFQGAMEIDMCFVCFFGKSGSDQVTTPMCFMCFCVFLISAKIAQPCILCVFVFFWLEVQTRSHHLCV